VEAAEQKLPIEELVQRAVDEALVEDFKFPAVLARTSVGSSAEG
jgi:hypothetical protein